MSTRESAHDRPAHNAREVNHRKSRAAETEAAKQLQAILKRVSTTESMLVDARGSGVPSLMRNGIERALLLLHQLVQARDRLIDASAKRTEETRELLDRAELDELQLRTSIARVRVHVDEMERAQGGPLSQLPQGELQTSPEAIRRQAMENAPPGLCDDPLLEGSIACPLDDALRASNRQLVTANLVRIGDNWRSALQNLYTDARFKSLLKSGGASAIRDMLLALALGWIGGAVVGAAVGKMGAKYAVKVAMRESAASIDDLKGALSALGKKGGEKLASRVPSAAPPDNLGALMQGFQQLASDWQVTATLAVRHLPDAALTALAAGLNASPFTVEYFQARLEILLQRYAALDKAMGTYGWAAAQTTTIWVVHPKGGGRMALVREDTEDVSSGHGRAKDFVSRTTGRYVFVSWVDRSLESVALAIGRQRHLATNVALTTTDTRWVDAGAPALADWHANPGSRDDVSVFGHGGE